MRDLKVTGVSASHPGARVLHDIDLTVADGTTTAVLGPSGCGKTTLLRVIAGFMRPDAGEVRLGDQLMVGPGTWVPPEKRGFGYVAQEGNLFPHLDIAANVLYGVPRRERKDRERIGELLELVGLPADLAGRRPDQLSGGQQQRVALARALARRPQLVLLDEPFSALDPELRASTRDAVAAALRHEQATVVLVTHDQAEALSFADQVAIMHGGRLEQVGPPTRVYREPTGRRARPRSARRRSCRAGWPTVSSPARWGRCACRTRAAPERATSWCGPSSCGWAPRHRHRSWRRSSAPSTSATTPWCSSSCSAPSR